MSNRQLPGQTEPTTHGTIDRVPCPHCGKANDFRDQKSQATLDTGSSFTCDACGNVMEVTALRTVEVIYVRKGTTNRPIPHRRGAPPPPQRRQVAQPQQQRGILSRLLGGPKR